MSDPRCSYGNKKMERTYAAKLRYSGGGCIDVLRMLLYALVSEASVTDITIEEMR
ncbi:MAG: hypothetical protein KAH23_03175 [Kiritimatiellae bacterium]|nr:hypothetical protein [Kiritimatiellia bacterium]